MTKKTDIKVRGRFSPPIVVSHKTDQPSLTKQSFKDEADINNITKKYLPGQFIGDPRATRQPMFGDFPSLDYHAMQNHIIDTQQAFAALPARVRRRFGEDPYQLLRFLENKENHDEAVKLGLIEGPPKLPGLSITDFINSAKPDPVEESKNAVKAVAAPSTP